MNCINPKIVYSEEYDITVPFIEHFHPFDGRKFTKALKDISHQCPNIRYSTVSVDRCINEDELLLIHTKDYLKKLNSIGYVASVLELPLPARGVLSHLPHFMPFVNSLKLQSLVLKPMLYGTRGTMIAAQNALKYGAAINMSGGYHHASVDNGEGFCFFADVPITVQYLRKIKELKDYDQILYIDLDVHQGNGVERCFLNDDKVYIFDMYNSNIYPNDQIAKARIDMDLPLRSGTSGGQYLNLLKEKLPQFIEALRSTNAFPKLAFYNAGTDVYERDPLGKFRLTLNNVYERDKFVFDTLTQAQIPWVMVLGGGYTNESHKMISASVLYVLETWGQ